MAVTVSEAATVPMVSVSRACGGMLRRVDGP
jgi:hypothetical protein